MPILTTTVESSHVSFDALYEQYHTAIARRVKCFLVRDADLIEDVCQETWIAAWKALESVPAPTYSWLYRIATNMAINALRKKYHYWGQRDGKPIPPPLSLDAHAGEECDAARGEMIEDPKYSDPAESRRVDIEQALSHLSPKARYLLRLRAQGYKLAEIEQITGTGRRMTWLHVDRARKAFRQHYQEQEVA
jgi:RNA polymerase sigma factor (sigma-70 family)